MRRLPRAGNRDRDEGRPALDDGNFPHLVDARQEIRKRSKVTEENTYVFLDREGETVFRGDDLQGRCLADTFAVLVP